MARLETTRGKSNQPWDAFDVMYIVHVSVLALASLVDGSYLGVPGVYRGVGTFAVRKANQLACIQTR